MPFLGLHRLHYYKPAAAGSQIPSKTHRRMHIPHACMHAWNPQYQFATGDRRCSWSTQLYTQLKQAKAEQRVTVWTAEEEQQQRVWLPVSHKMTFIHSHPDSTDPCEEAEEGGRQRKGAGRMEGCFCPLAASLCSCLWNRYSSFPWEEAEEEGETPSRWTRWRGKKQSRMENKKEKRHAFHEKMVVNQSGMGRGTQINGADREGSTGAKRSKMKGVCWLFCPETQVQESVPTRKRRKLSSSSKLI